MQTFYNTDVLTLLVGQKVLHNTTDTHTF